MTVKTLCIFGVIVRCEVVTPSHLVRLPYKTDIQFPKKYCSIFRGDLNKFYRADFES